MDKPSFSEACMNFYEYMKLRGTIDYIGLGKSQLLPLVPSAYYVIETNGYDLATPLVLHLASAFRYIFSQPNSASLKKILSSYSKHLKPPKKTLATLGSLATGTAFSAAILANQEEPFVYLKDYVFNSVGTAKSPYLALEELMKAGILFEAARAVHGQSRIAYSYFTLSKHNISEEFSLLFKNVKTTTSTAFTKLNALFSTNKSKALGSYMDVRLEKKIQPSHTSTDAVKEKLLHMYGDKPLLSYIQSRIGVDMNQYTRYFKEKARKEAQKENNLSEQTLLAIDDFLDTGSRTSFAQVAPLILADPNIKRKLVAQGMRDQVHLIEYDGIDGALSHSLRLKTSRNFKKHKQKYEFHKELTFSKYTNDVLHLDQATTESVIFDMLAPGKSVSNLVRDQPELLQTAYRSIDGICEDMKHMKMDTVNLREKFTELLKLDIPEVERVIHENQERLSSSNLIPALDFHTENLFPREDYVYTVDLEHKGLTTRFHEIANIVEFSFGQLSYQDQTMQRKNILEQEQQRLNMELPELVSHYFPAVLERGFAYTQARLGTSSSTPFLTHLVNFFQNSEYTYLQPELAKRQTQVIESLLKTV